MRRYPTIATITLLSASGALRAQDVSWQLIRPSNTGVPGDYTQTIFIDDDNSPWIGGYIPFWEEGGVGHFDGTNWRVLNNVDCPQIGQQIGAPRFNDIVKTSDGIMWIGSSRGLLRFDPSEEPWCVTKYTPGNSGIAGADVSNIDIAPDGTLWMSCATWGGGTQGGLSQYDPATDTWNSWDTSNGLPWWAGWDWVDYLAVQPDAGGGYTVWFGSAEMGLTTYKEGLFIWYGSPTPPNVDPLPYNTLGKDPVLDNGDMLMSTEAGIAFRHPDGTYTVIGSGPFGVGGSSIARVEPISGNRVLLGTYGADVYLWDGAGWNALGNWGSGNHTYVLTEDHNGAFWAGGIGGASKYENGVWQRYRLTNTGFTAYFPDAVAHAPNGDVAFGTNAGTGVGGFDILHPDATWTNASVATYGLGYPWPYPTDSTSALAYRANGSLLFAPTNNGVKELTDEGDFIEHIANGWPIKHIAVAGNGRAWASTGSGTAFQELADGSWLQFSQGDGVPVGGITDIVADPNDPDAVFIGAAFGIVRTDGVSWEVTPREAVGLNLDTLGYHVWSFDIADDGTMWIGSGIGLFHYDPATGLYDTYDLSNSPLPSDDIHYVEVAPDGSVWVSMFDGTFPYPGGVAQLKDGVWSVWSQGSSPLPHNQHSDLESRSVAGGYEVWIATASEAVAVITVETGVACPADLAEPFGQLDFSDVAAFLTAFGAMAPEADLVEPFGQFDFSDVAAFLTAFGAGCP